jgi:hypothetical protein
LLSEPEEGPVKWLNSLETMASSASKGLVDSAGQLEGGAAKALSDAWHGAVESARSGLSGGFAAAEHVTDGVAKGAGDFAAGIARGDPGAGLASAASDVRNGVAAGIGDIWEGTIGGTSHLLDGLNGGVHDLGAAAQGAYASAVDDVATGIDAVAGQGGGDRFRQVAMAAELPLKTAAQFGWGVVEGVTEGVGGAVKGVGSLVGDAYRFETDSRYRASVVAAVEQGASYVAEHPLDAAGKAGTALKDFAAGIYQGGVQAARNGDLAEYIGKGVGQAGVVIATTLVAPEADIAEGAGAATVVAGDLAGDLAEGTALARGAATGADAAIADASRAGDAAAGVGRSLKAGPSGARYVEQPTPAEAAAYERIAATADDVPKIAQHTGIDQTTLSRVKAHLFEHEHTLTVSDDAGNLSTRIGRFTPDGRIADLWTRATDGTLSSSERAEFGRLIAHEYVEQGLMADGLPYRSAAAWQDGVNFPGPTAYGAHDLAPLVDPGRAPFSHWGMLGKSAEGLGLEPDGSNLQQILQTIRRMEGLGS